jgi:transcriptional regulator with XRE-family HTH domain
MKGIGARMMAFREMHGLKQNDIHERTGFSQSHVSAIERGMKMPSAEVLVAYLNAFEDFDANQILVDGLIRDKPLKLAPAKKKAKALADEPAVGETISREEFEEFKRMISQLLGKGKSGGA